MKSHITWSGSESANALPDPLQSTAKNGSHLCIFHRCVSVEFKWTLQSRQQDLYHGPTTDERDPSHWVMEEERMKDRESSSAIISYSNAAITL